jgi:hypothetical protein
LNLLVNALPIAEAGPDQILECTSPTTILEGSVSGGIPLWTGPGINAGNQNDLTPTVSLPEYILTVTSPSGCEDMVQ